MSRRDDIKRRGDNTVDYSYKNSMDYGSSVVLVLHFFVVYQPVAVSLFLLLTRASSVGESDGSPDQLV